jgi:hypothetical protein
MMDREMGLSGELHRLLVFMSLRRLRQYHAAGFRLLYVVDVKVAHFDAVRTVE